MATIQVKRGPSANLNTAMETLKAGELVFLTDTGILGVYDGSKVIPANPKLGTAADKDVGTSAGDVVEVGTDGKINAGLLPAIAITTPYAVEDEAGMLALDAQTGDIAIRSDISKTYILRQSPASELDNWLELLTPTDAVSSVNGQTGVVTLDKDDLGLDNVDNTADMDKPVSTETQVALDAKAPLESPALTGEPTAPTPGDGAGDDAIATTGYVKARGYLTADSVIDGGIF